MQIVIRAYATRSRSHSQMSEAHSGGGGDVLRQPRSDRSDPEINSLRPFREFVVRCDRLLLKFG